MKRLAILAIAVLAVPSMALAQMQPIANPPEKSHHYHNHIHPMRWAHHLGHKMHKAVHHMTHHGKKPPKKGGY
jgi:hypothetical protein